MRKPQEDTVLGQLWQAVENPQADPFVLRRFGPEEALLAAPAFRELIVLWRDRRGAAAVPDWADFDFPDFRGWHSAIMVSDLADDEPDPRFRIIGEDYRVIRDSSVPGQRFSEHVPRLYDLQFREHFRQIRDQGLIGWAVGPAALVGREHIRLNVLELPFRNGGAAVTRLVHVMRHDLAG